MKVFFKEIVFSTKNKLEIHNITSQVNSIVKESGIRNGIAIIHAPHATAAVILNEDEKGLKQDVLEWIQKNIPYEYAWRHNLIDDNAGAHIASAVIGSTRILPVKNNSLVRGTWQEILFIELDGPRSQRRILVEIMGE